MILRVGFAHYIFQKSYRLCHDRWPFKKIFATILKLVPAIKRRSITCKMVGICNNNNDNVSHGSYYNAQGRKGKRRLEIGEKILNCI